jgi:hypothetical protein
MLKMCFENFLFLFFHDILGVICLQHLWRMYCLLDNAHSMEDGHFFASHQNDIICTTWHSLSLVQNKGDQSGPSFFSLFKKIHLNMFSGS